jgi:leader peptidase (prepilin peptidase)/N-methyltransferase
MTLPLFWFLLKCVHRIGYEEDRVIMLLLFRILLWTTITMLGLFAGVVINILMYHIPRILQQNWQRQCRALLQCGETSVTYLFSTKKLRLHCLNCDSMLPAWINLPLLRVLGNSGICLHCGQQIGKRYSWVELGVSIVTVVITLHFGVHYATAAILMLAWGLVLLALIDSAHYLLPDCITLALIWLGLLSNACGLFISPEQSIIGAVAGYTSLWVIGALYKLMRGTEGIGHGDYKLLAVFGAWWGVYPLPVIVFLASVSGSVVAVITMLCGRRGYHAPLPFGPYLVVAGLVVLLFSF